jgi:hypothetical protein
VNALHCLVIQVVFLLGKQVVILVSFRNIAYQIVRVQAEMALTKNDEAAHSFEKVFVC